MHIVHNLRLRQEDDQILGDKADSLLLHLLGNPDTGILCHAKLTADDTHIRVTAKKFAKNVQILDEAGELKLSDNYFDMQPGSRVLTVLEGKPENLNVLSVFDIR